MIIYRATQFEDTGKRTSLHRQIVTEDWPYRFEKWDGKKWVDDPRQFEALGFDASSLLVEITIVEAGELLVDLGGSIDKLEDVSESVTVNSQEELDALLAEAKDKGWVVENA